MVKGSLLSFGVSYQLDCSAFRLWCVEERRNDVKLKCEGSKGVKSVMDQHQYTREMGWLLR